MITVALLDESQKSGSGSEPVVEAVGEAVGEADVAGVDRVRRKKKAGSSNNNGKSSAQTASANAAAAIDLSLLGVPTEVVPNP